MARSLCCGVCSCCHRRLPRFGGMMSWVRAGGLSCCVFSQTRHSHSPMTRLAGDSNATSLLHRYRSLDWCLVSLLSCNGQSISLLVQAPVTCRNPSGNTARRWQNKYLRRLVFLALSDVAQTVCFLLIDNGVLDDDSSDRAGKAVAPREKR